MKSNFALCLIVFSIYSINCLDLKKATLHDLCSKDVFDYDNRQVNGVFRIVYNLTITHWFSIQASTVYNFDGWTENKTEVEELNYRRTRYNQIIKDVYTNEKINNMTYAQLLEYKLFAGNTYRYFYNWWDRLTDGFKKNENLYIHSAIKQGSSVIDKILAAKNDQLNELIIPENFIISNAFELGEQLNGTGRLAFDDADYYRYYSERILKFDKAVAYGYFDISFPQSYVLLSVYLPVNNFNYKPRNIDCVTANDLPTFFKENSRAHN